MNVQVAPSFFKSLKRIGSPWEKFREAIYWIRMHTNKRFLRVLKATLKSYPYDSSFLLEIEQAKLNEIADYIEANDRFVGCEFVVRDIRLCVRLIEILKHETDYFHFNGEIRFVPSGKVDEDGNEIMELKPTPDFEYVCDVNVNKRNINRFARNQKEKETFENQPHELYLRKARCLYHKIRSEREQEWWD